MSVLLELDPEDYDLTGDCEPSCSCFRGECPEFFCATCLKVIPYPLIMEHWPEFDNYCECLEPVPGKGCDDE